MTAQHDLKLEMGHDELVIRQRYETLGLGSRAWDTTLIDSQFDYAPDTSFSDAAKATYDTARQRDGQAGADAVRAGFAARHIYF